MPVRSRVDSGRHRTNFNTKMAREKGASRGGGGEEAFSEQREKGREEKSKRVGGAAECQKRREGRHL